MKEAKKNSSDVKKEFVAAGAIGEDGKTYQPPMINDDTKWYIVFYLDKV